MENYWDKVLFNNTLREWVFCFSVILVSILVLRVFQLVIIKKIKAISSRTKTTIDDFAIAMIQSSVMPVLYLLALYFGIQYLNVPEKVSKVIQTVMLLGGTFFSIRVVTSFIHYLFIQGLNKTEENGQRQKQTKGVLLIVQSIVWMCGILFLIDNLGYDITTLVAGLGIGGVAIALAAQTILGDLFSYLVIFFDKPFEVGDFIIVQDKMGTVEYIGIKTTRLRTLNGEQLICANTDLTNSRVHNYKRMQERRVVFSFGVVYHTPAAKLRMIPELVRNIIEGLDGIRFDRAHFQAFGDFSLNFEVVYYVLSPDYTIYMDKQEAINLKLFELFEKEQIEFAFPTQTILLNRIEQKEVLPDKRTVETN